jgi:hypothetical protein
MKAHSDRNEPTWRWFSHDLHGAFARHKSIFRKTQTALSQVEKPRTMPQTPPSGGGGQQFVRRMFWQFGIIY